MSNQKNKADAFRDFTLMVEGRARHESVEYRMEFARLAREFADRLEREAGGRPFSDDNWGDNYDGEPRWVGADEEKP